MRFLSPFPFRGGGPGRGASPEAGTWPLSRRPRQDPPPPHADRLVTRSGGVAIVLLPDAKPFHGRRIGVRIGGRPDTGAAVPTGLSECP